MGSGSCSTIVEESEEIDGGRSNCFFVAIGSLLFPSLFKSSPMETGNVCDQDEHQVMVYGCSIDKAGRFSPPQESKLGRNIRQVKL
jgi:hypothetical protein